MAPGEAMTLDAITIGIVLVGLILYTVLGGADFGAGVWQLLAGSGARGRQIRDHAHHANAPVWEANHVWLVLVITVLWTGYPIVFGSIFSTLAIPIFVAAIGIVLRGMAYTLQNAANARQRRYIDTAFAVSSILTPFMLGTVIGAIASGRVPVGNARGDAITSWVNPTSILAGCLAVATGAFLAAVYLAADAARLRDQSLTRAFHNRALAAGVTAGLVSIIGLVVIDSDAHQLFHGLLRGWGLAAVIVSAAAGFVSLALIVRQAYEASRLSAAVAVAALLLGWTAAQRPYVLPPTLTLSAGAAATTTQVALIISVGIGAIILFPSLAVLFRLALTGRFDPGAARASTPDVEPTGRRRGRSARAAFMLFLAGVVLLTIADPPAAHAFGIVALMAAGIVAFTAVGPDELANQPAARPAPGSRSH